MEEKIGKLMEALQQNPKAQELAKNMKKPESDEEAAEAYAGLAKDLGFDLSADDLLKVLETKEQEQRFRTKNAALAVEKASLTEGDLELVAGGKNEYCDDTFTTGEWCWFNDSCSTLITVYELVEGIEGEPGVVSFNLDTNPFVPPEVTQAASDEEIWNDIYGPGTF